MRAIEAIAPRPPTTPAELAKMREQFMLDIKPLIDMKVRLVSMTIPSMVIDTTTMEIESKLPEDVKAVLDEIDKQIRDEAERRFPVRN